MQFVRQGQVLPRMSEKAIREHSAGSCRNLRPLMNQYAGRYKHALIGEREGELRPQMKGPPRERKGEPKMKGQKGSWGLT